MPQPVSQTLFPGPERCADEASQMAVACDLRRVLLDGVRAVRRAGAPRDAASAGTRAAAPDRTLHGASGLCCLGVKLKILGAERLPSERCIVVANHASYLDGLVLTAALPPRFAFVIKKEMDRVPLANLPLRRIRFGIRRPAQSSQGSHGRPPRAETREWRTVAGVLPRGTFSTRPGLLRFHTGAFATAVRANCTVTPAVIHGARKVLSNSSVIPTQGRSPSTCCRACCRKPGTRKRPRSSEMPRDASCSCGWVSRISRLRRSCARLRSRRHRKLRTLRRYCPPTS